MAGCRRSCAINAGCNAWVHCWEPGGCDDGRDVRPDMYPDQVASARFSLWRAERIWFVMRSCPNVASIWLPDESPGLYAADRIPCSSPINQLSRSAQACELFDASRDRPLHAEGRGPMFSSSSSGFLPMYSGDLQCPSYWHNIARP